MKIIPETSPPYSAPRTLPSSTPDTGPSSFSSALAAGNRSNALREACRLHKHDPSGNDRLDERTDPHWKDVAR